MQITSTGSSITLEIPYTFNDTILTLTDFKFTVLDASGNVLYGPVSDPAFNPANNQSTIMIDGSYNVITTKYDVRQVQCQLITASGTFLENVFYQIQGNVLVLTPLQDSFMTYPESLLIRMKITDPMDYYDALTDEEKAIVLENSFETLKDVTFNLPQYKELSMNADPESDDYYSDDTLYWGYNYDYSIGRRYRVYKGTKLTLLTVDQFNALDPKLLEAVKKAQIAQANHLCEVNPVKDKIRMGIISETIGESSMFFKQNMDYLQRERYPGVSDIAFPYLAKYLWKPTGSSNTWKVRRS